MKIFVIVAVVLMMIAGGSFSVMKSFQLGPFAPEQEVSNEPVISDEPAIYIDMEPLLINIFEDASVATVVQVTVKLETLGKDNASLVNKSLPKITDAFLSDLHSFLPRIMKDNDSRIDIFVIKKRLKLMADRLYPDMRINNVLIQSISDGS